jgi:tetratricopeptide (TPR) repeat protein
MQNDLGKAYQQQGELAKAELAYRKAIEWYPAVWAEPVVRLSEVYWAQGESERAMSLLKDALSSTDMGHEARFGLARQIAIFADKRGDMQLAYCCARFALLEASLAGYNYAPESWRKHLRQIIDRLEPEIKPDLRCEFQLP